MDTFDPEERFTTLPVKSRQEAAYHEMSDNEPEVEGDVRAMCCILAYFKLTRLFNPGVHLSQLLRWDQRVRERRAVAAGLVAAQRDVGSEA